FIVVVISQCRQIHGHHREPGSSCLCDTNQDRTIHAGHLVLQQFRSDLDKKAGLGCMPYLPHTASTSTAEKNRKASPYSDERPGWTGPSAAVGTTGGAAFFNCSSSV